MNDTIKNLREEIIKLREEKENILYMVNKTKYLIMEINQFLKETGARGDYPEFLFTYVKAKRKITDRELYVFDFIGVEAPMFASDISRFEFRLQKYGLSMRMNLEDIQRESLESLVTNKKKKRTNHITKVKS